MSTIAMAAALKALTARISERVPERLLHGDPRFSKLLTRHEKLRSAVEALEDMRVNPNLSESGTQQAVKAAGMARELAAKITELRATTEADALSARGEFLAEARKQSGMQADGFAVELRQRFATLDPGERMRVLLDYAKTGRGPELAALLDAPRLLTGISDAQAADAQTLLFETVCCPDLMRTQGHYNDLVEHVAGGLLAAATAAEETQDLRAMRAAVAADKAFTTAQDSLKEVGQ